MISTSSNLLSYISPRTAVVTVVSTGCTLFTYYYDSSVFDPLFSAVGTVGYENPIMLIIGGAFLYSMSAFIYQSVKANNPPKVTATLKKVDEIQDPAAYFQLASQQSQLVLKLEMMNNAILALLLKGKSNIPQALQWIDKMPSDCVQRNYGLDAIVRLQAEDCISDAYQTALRMSNSIYFGFTLNFLFPNKSSKDKIAIVKRKFPNLSSENQQTLEQLFQD